MMRRRSVHVDDETWLALTDYAAESGENASALARDALRAFLAPLGYEFATDPRRYNRRGEGRRT